MAAWPDLPVVYEARGGRVLAELEHGAGTDNTVIFSPNGRLIAGSGDSPTVHIWDAATGQQLLSVQSHQQGDEALAFSPDSTRLASGGLRTARVWDGDTGRNIATLHTQQRGCCVDNIAFSPDGRLILTHNDGDGRALVGDVASRRRIASLPALEDAMFSPRGRLALSWGREPWLWDISDEKRIGLLSGHEGYVLAASFSPDGQFVATAGADDTTRLWQVTSGSELGIISRHRAGATAVAFSPAGRFILSAGRRGAARIYPCEICAPIDRVIELARQRVQGG